MMKVSVFRPLGILYLVEKLEAGCFVSDWSQVPTREMDWTALKLMLEGIEPGRLRKRYQLPKSLKNAPSNTTANTIAALQCANGTSADEQPPERG
jgi:hypothetical protein